MTKAELKLAVQALESLGYVDSHKMNWRARHAYAEAFDSLSTLVHELEREEGYHDGE